MKRFELVIAVAAAAVLSLSACSFTIVGPPPADFTREANAEPESAVWAGTVAAGASVVFELNVPSWVRAGHGVLYLELDRDLQLELRAPDDYRLVASSSGPSFFAWGSLGILSASADDLGAAAIGVPIACRGSCIIIPAKNAYSYYARVVNRAGGAQAVNLYFYGDDEQDDGEPYNDSAATAGLLDMASLSGVQGAIELLGDVDYWKVSATGTVSFYTAAGNPVGLVVEARQDGTWRPVIDKDAGSAMVYLGETIRVRSAVDRAGPSGSSRYTLLGN